MTQIDEFESLFNSAAKPVFQLEPQTFRKVLLIFDDSASAGSAYETQVRQLLTALSGVEKDVECEVLENSQFESVANLLEQVRDIGPDIICTYRNLRIPATDYPYSLGVYVDVLTQATSIPVLLFPRPEQVELESIEFDNPKKVVAVTDHLAGDRHLVSMAAAFTAPQGTLVLAHVEDEQTFERYIGTISRIPDIDTDLAREVIMEQLLKEPRDYIASCIAGIREAAIPISVESIITAGHHLSDYRQMIRDNRADLVVINTKDSDQLAMHGLAYPISVELREIPMLLL